MGKFIPCLSLILRFFLIFLMENIHVSNYIFFIFQFLIVPVRVSEAMSECL